MNNTPEVYPTKSWEGHFKTVEDFRKNTERMELKRGESVWVLSNRTLERVLKDQYNAAKQ